jgi:hypothetical protein
MISWIMSGFKPKAAGSEQVLDALWQAAGFSGEIEDGVAAAVLPRLRVTAAQACAIEPNLFRSRQASGGEPQVAKLSGGQQLPDQFGLHLRPALAQGGQPRAQVIGI